VHDAAPTRDPPARVAVIGGGWAGCAAAVTLADAGIPVTLFEQAKTLGGRARRGQWAAGRLGPRIQLPDLLVRGHQRRGRLGRRGHGDAATRTALEPLPDQLALVVVEAAQLVLDVNADLLADVEQVLALHVQHLGQGINPHFLFLLLQAPLLLSMCRPTPGGR